MKCNMMLWVFPIVHSVCANHGILCFVCRIHYSQVQVISLRLSLLICVEVYFLLRLFLARCKVCGTGRRGRASVWSCTWRLRMPMIRAICLKEYKSD
jgi:hypothetical protein